MDIENAVREKFIAQNRRLLQLVLFLVTLLKQYLMPGMVIIRCQSGKRIAT